MMLGCYRYLSVERNNPAGQRRRFCGRCAKCGRLLVHLPADVPSAESRAAELAQATQGAGGGGLNWMRLRTELFLNALMLIYAYISIKYHI